MNKQEFNQLIGKRISKILEELHFSQAKLLLTCETQGYHINQSTLSKLISGSSIQLLHLAQICEVLKLNPAEILSLNPDETIHCHYERSASIEQSQIISDARNSAFRGYKGIYQIYFYTTKNENIIHHGTFELKEDPVSHRCIVNFCFKTGEKDESGKDIEKKYSGNAHYSIPMQTIYCELFSSEIGEISYLLFHYHFLAYQNLECRLASAITVSSGGKRLPTMHRFLLTKKELSNDDLDYLCGELKLNSSEILITEIAYREFLRDPKLPPKFFEYFGNKETQAEQFISSVAKIPYYSFNESLISDSFLPPLDKIKIICLLRKYSSAARYNKISEKAEEIVYNYFEIQKKDNISAAKYKKQNSPT